MKKSSGIGALIWSALRETRAMKWEYLISVPLTLLMVGAFLAEPYIYKLVLDAVVASPYQALPNATLSDQFREIFTPLIWIFVIWIGASSASIWIKYYRNTRFHRRFSNYWIEIIASGMGEFLKKDIFFHLSVNNAEKIKVFNR
jgi:ABC-type multidrug transport system fused ATPase/permease subunit